MPASFGELAAVGNTLFFTYSDGRTGLELWKSDGTPAGTVRVKDIRPGLENERVSRLVEAGGALYFLADDGLHGKELWRSDGTETGTVMDIHPGPTGLTHHRVASVDPRARSRTSAREHRKDRSPLGRSGRE